MKKLYLSILLGILSVPIFALNTITVITPNGGENWIKGCPTTIQWITAAATTVVKIELFKNGTFYLTICNQVPAGQNSYIWTPSYMVVQGSDYKVKITNISSNVDFDFSDNYFSITAGVITVVLPNGGEVWQKGTTHLVTWTDNICENVRIELWKDGVYNSLITYSTPSTGSFSWMIPSTSTLVPGNDYKIKIMSVPASNTTGIVFDFSDNNFTISQGSFITVTVPNGGEIWIKGTTRIITWIDNIPQNVRIELWKGGVYNSVINPSTPSNGSCYWAIPMTIPSGNDYKVKIMAINTTNGLYDFSDNNFSIIGATNQIDLKSGQPQSTGISTSVYPNPCDDRLNLKFPIDPLHPASVEIINLTGKIVLSQLIKETTDPDGLEVITSGLSAGIYIFVIRNSDGILYRNPLIIRH